MTTDLPGLGVRARGAARVLAQASSAAKDAALHAAAELLLRRSAELLDANRADVERAERDGSTVAVVDRLRLTPARVESMASGLRKVADLADPVGEVTAGWVRPNGLRIRQVRVPLGVVGIIYENRPNVTSDAAALCVVLREGFAKAGLPEDSVVLVEDTSRESAVTFMRLRGFIDCLIPRGGPSLIASILEHATVPYVIDGDGNCHVYVDASADLDMAVDIIVNAKTQRPSVCNAAESLLVHAAVAPEFLPRAAAALDGVELVGDEASRAIAAMGEATDDDYASEFLALKLAVRVVPSLEDAIAHITRFGSGHSEAIVTRDLGAAQRFTQEVDAAAVLVNASTRFVDGEEFGFGAEIGISTQKLHARGPMGLRELTTQKYVVEGTGQIRA
jgi:glutamate-5-semialdehyde dehydrogenase